MGKCSMEDEIYNPTAKQILMQFGTILSDLFDEAEGERDALCRKLAHPVYIARCEGQMQTLRDLHKLVEEKGSALPESFV